MLEPAFSMALTASSASVGVLELHAESLLPASVAAIAGGGTHLVGHAGGVPHQQRHLDDAEDQEHQQRRHQGSLDRHSASLGTLSTCHGPSSDL